MPTINPRRLNLAEVEITTTPPLITTLSPMPSTKKRLRRRSPSPHVKIEKVDEPAPEKPRAVMTTKSTAATRVSSSKSSKSAKKGPVIEISSDSQDDDEYVEEEEEEEEAQQIDELVDSDVDMEAASARTKSTVRRNPSRPGKATPKVSTSKSRSSKYSPVALRHRIAAESNVSDEPRGTFPLLSSFI